MINRTEELFLLGPERPILLLRKRPGNMIAAEVAPANDYFGIMLPSAPLHYLLLRDNFAALVMTSANLSDEPIIYKDEDALEQLAGIADFFLGHNRPIYAPSDDSVIRAFRTHPLMLRRSRGYVPRPVMIPEIRQSCPCSRCGIEVCCLSGGLVTRHFSAGIWGISRARRHWHLLQRASTPWKR